MKNFKTGSGLYVPMAAAAIIGIGFLLISVWEPDFKPNEGVQTGTDTGNLRSSSNRIEPTPQTGEDTQLQQTNIGKQSCAFSDVESTERTYLTDSIDDIVRNVRGGNDVQSIKNFNNIYRDKWFRLTTAVNFQGSNNSIKSFVNCGDTVSLVIQMNPDNQQQLSIAESYARGSTVTLDARLERYHPERHISLKDAEFPILFVGNRNSEPLESSK